MLIQQWPAVAHLYMIGLRKKILNDTKSPKKNDIQVFYSNLLLGGDFKFKN